MADEAADWPRITYQGGEQPVRPAIYRVATRAATAGLKCAWSRLRDFDGTLIGPVSGHVYLPDGDGQRDLWVDERNAESWEKAPFERWHLLAGYDAIWDAEQRTITAVVKLDIRSQLRQVPGIEIADGRLPSNGFRLRVAKPHDRLSLTLQAPRPEELEIFPLGGLDAALQIGGMEAASHREAARLLVELSTSFFVDLSVNADVVCRLRPAFQAEKGDGLKDESPGASPPSFPVASYNRDAAALYLHARSLNSFTSAMFAYLAYYQVIEFFAPVYARAELVKQLRSAVKDPAFDPDDDASLGRVVATFNRSARSMMADREQATRTIRACVQEDELDSWLATRPVASKALADKNRIADIRLISRNDSSSVVSQVAARIYDLRCRIVHAKEDGGYVEPLRLFDSTNDNILAHDLELVRFVAERVLMASSAPLNV